MTQMSVADVLDKAADILDRDGWCTGTLGSDRGPKCALGAMVKAVGGSLGTAIPALYGAQGLAFHQAETVARRSLRVQRIGDWNDIAASVADVTSALRAISVMERAKEAPAEARAAETV